MLQVQTLPASLTVLLAALRPCFTAPSFATFTALAAGMIAHPGPRTITGMWSGAALAWVCHHGRAHWFFARARWNPDALALAVAALIVQQLLPVDAAVLVAVDDSLFRRSGRRVHAAAWCHDGAAKGPKGNRIRWGNCWVIASLVLTLPFLDRPICLPVTARVVAQERTHQTGPRRPAGHRGWPRRSPPACPGHAIHVVADAWYAGTDGAAGAARNSTRQHVGFPPQVSLTSRLRVNAIPARHRQPDPRPRWPPPPHRRQTGHPQTRGRHRPLAARQRLPLRPARHRHPHRHHAACGTASTDPALKCRSGSSKIASGLTGRPTWAAIGRWLYLDEAGELN